MKGIKLKRQEQISPRKAEAALSGLSGTLDKKSKEAAAPPDSQAPAEIVRKVSSDSASAAQKRIDPGEEINKLHAAISESLTVVAPTAEPIDLFASKAAIINERHHKLMQAGLEYLREMIAIGGELAEIKDQLKHGQWESWVADNLTFNIGTAQRYIRAFKKRYDPLASADPALFLAGIHGNIPAKNDTAKNDVDVAFDRDKGDTSKSVSTSKSRRNLHKLWSRAVADAREAIEQLIDLQNQYSDWLDELPDELRSSELSDRLLAISQIELERLLNTIQESASIELPHAFTKD